MKNLKKVVNTVDDVAKRLCTDKDNGTYLNPSEMQKSKGVCKRFHNRDLNAAINIYRIAETSALRISPGYIQREIFFFFS